MQSDKTKDEREEKTVTSAAAPDESNEDFLKNVTIFTHPLVQHKFTHLCDVNTGSKEFCELLKEITALMGYEVLKDLPTKTIEVQGPIKKFPSKVLDSDFTIVPILRAGLGMVDGLRFLLPTAKVGHIGLYRDEETLVPHTYYFKLPIDVAEGPVIVVDPALATGGSADAAIQYLKEEGCRDIRFMCVLSSEVGLRLLAEKHPDVPIYTAFYAPGPLNEKGYIYTSFGDAGDRVCGTCSYKHS
ncbi:MAG: uracil phosphoribosyltransferase [Eubacterium sp.]|jgi:uracil phosphoribosyltransferase